MNETRVFGVVLALAATIAAVDPHESQAQGSAGALPAEAKRRVRVVVAVVDTLSAPYRIVRHGNPKSGDVIALRTSSADGEVLLAAVLSMNAIRDVGGDTASADGTFRSAGAPTRVASSPTELVAAQAFVARLLAGPSRAIDSFGTVRARDVYLPSRGMRRWMKARARKKG